MTLTEFLERFERPSKTGHQWLVKCPSHEDRKASLAIREGEDGRIVVHCHAGCEVADIVAALGLQMKNLFVSSPTRASGLGDIVATYDYQDVSGTLLYQVVRYAPKDFRQRCPDGHGGWTWKLNGVPRVLYRLPELAGRDAVVICEGEKDADALWNVRIPATTNVSGAGKWREEYVAQLTAAGVKRVRIIPDNDDPGRQHADEVVRSCLAAGIDARIVTLPSLPPKADVSDFLAAHPVTALHELLRNAPVFTASTPGDFPRRLPSMTLGELLAKPDEHIDWLVDGRLRGGTLNMIAGKPKAGKSTLVRDLALQVAQGGQWLSWHCTQGAVWYCCFEDHEDDVKKHFRQMGGRDEDPIRLFFPPVEEHMFTRLAAEAVEARPALIIVDTMMRLVPMTDLNSYAEVTAKLSPLSDLARVSGAVVLLVHHARKGDGLGIDAVLGSQALAGSCANILVFSRREETNQRTLVTRQRVGTDLSDTIVTLSAETGRSTLGGSKHIADVEALAREMVDQLRDSGDTMTRTDLEKLVGGTTKSKRRATQLLRQPGSGVIVTGSGKSGDPFVFAVESRVRALGSGHEDTTLGRLPLDLAALASAGEGEI
jgi:hypothetical protein